VPVPQRTVEAELKQGKIVLLLFWNPQGADDVAVRSEVRGLAAHEKKIALHEALAKQVATFGSITRGVQVEQTPTILIINKRGRATTLTGLTDAFSIEQAIAEARRS
jgi:predicted nucleotidyltransferase